MIFGPITLVEEEIPSDHLQENLEASAQRAARSSPTEASPALHRNNATASSSQVLGLLFLSLYLRLKA
jgi:hypothetical protein